MKHLDKNGTELHVGDTVRYGLAEGSVLILEDWAALGHLPAVPGVYVSNIGTWGDCRAVPASRVEKVEA